jgi:HEAT repeat protein
MNTRRLIALMILAGATASGAARRPPSPGPALAGLDRAEEALAHVWSVLESAAERGSLEDAAVVDELTAAGPASIAVLYQAWNGRRPQPEGKSGARGRRSGSPSRFSARQRLAMERTLERALEATGKYGLREFLREEAHRGEDGAAALRVLVLLQRVGPPAAAGLALEVAAEIEAQGLDSATAWEAFEKTVRACLARDAGAFEEIAAGLADLGPTAFGHAVDALVDEGSPRAFRLLLDQVGTEERRDVVLLGRLVEGVSPFDDRNRRAVLERAQAALEARSPALRRMAARCLGELQDEESCRALIGLLEDPDRGVRASAHQALQTLSGVTLAPQRDLWSAWWRGEQEWWDSRSFPALEALHKGSESRVLAAIRELAGHRLYRRRLTDELVAVLKYDQVALRSAACAALGQLECERALPHLRGALEDPDSRVRAVAWQGLRIITGMDLPPTPTAWDKVAMLGG